MEIAFWNNNLIPDKDLRELLDFFKQLTAIQSMGKTAAGYEPLLVPVSPLATYHDINSLVDSISWGTHTDPPLPIRNLGDDVIHCALIQIQGPESNMIPIGPPPPTHAVFVCRDHKTYVNLRNRLGERNILNFQTDERMRPFRYNNLRHHYIPFNDAWEAFCQQQDVQFMKLNCPNECHTPLFDRLYKEFNKTHWPNSRADMDGVKEWFNSIAIAGKPDQPSLV